jgi:hypothetical protein
MSKKTLLNEATVRRFMKLANVGSLSDKLISEMGMGAYGARDDEDEDFPPEEAPLPPEAGGEDELGLDEPGLDEPMDEPALDVGGEADEVEISEEDRDVLGQAAEILSRIAGDAGGDLGGMEPEMEPEIGPGPEAGPEAGLEDEEDEEEILDEVELIDEKELVQEVTRRVAQRLRSVLKKRK